MTDSLYAVLRRRDNLSHSEAKELISELRQRVNGGEDPEEILHDELGLEPDYIFDLLD